MFWVFVLFNFGCVVWVFLFSLLLVNWVLFLVGGLWVLVFLLFVWFYVLMLCCLWVDGYFG